jgi:protein-tyrosine phosphatase
MIKILFVCKGNICRSPTAEGVFRKRVEQAGLTNLIGIDSAGTHHCHVGKQPDDRTRAVAKRRGVDLDGMRARCLRSEDFQEFDYILTMVRKNLARINMDYPEQQLEKAQLFLDYGKPYSEKDVPDPYYGGHDDFERVLDIIEEKAGELLEYLIEKHALRSCIN